MAINYTYNPVTDGVTDASAAYMNNMQAGIKAACDGVDTANNNLTTLSNDLGTFKKRSNSSAILADNVDISTLQSGIYATTPNNLPNILKNRTELSEFNGYGTLMLFNNEYPFIMYLDAIGRLAVWAFNSSTWVVIK